MAETARAAGAEKIMPIWPQPVEMPLYVSVQKAAKIAGVSYETMSAWADAQSNPIPHIKVGRGGKRLIRTAALPEYLRAKEAR